MLENDLLLERFFAVWEGRLSGEDHDGLARLLELSDNELLDLLVGNAHRWVSWTVRMYGRCWRRSAPNPLSVCLKGNAHVD